MNTGRTIGRLKALKKAVLADGKVDWNETEQLLAIVRPLAQKHGFLFQDYERLLEKCREDGKITKEESEKLAFQLDFRFLLAPAARMACITGPFRSSSRSASPFSR